MLLNFQIGLSNNNFEDLGSISLLYWLKGAKQHWITLNKNESGIFESTENLGKYASSGVYEIRKISFDSGGFAYEYPDTLIEELGFQKQLTLDNPNSDSWPPIVREFTLSPFNFNEEAQQWETNYSLFADDNLSGLETSWILELSNPSGSSLQQHATFSEDGRSSGVFVLPRETPSGVYKINTLRVYDQASNSGWV